MSQVNVNSPGDGGRPVGEPAGSSAGFILGIIVAILIIVALIYFLVIAPGADNGGGGDPANGDGVDPGSSWILTDIA